MKLFLEIKLFLAHTDWGMFSHPPNAHGTKAACGVDPLSASQWLKGVNKQGRFDGGLIAK